MGRLLASLLLLLALVAGTPAAAQQVSARSAAGSVPLLQRGRAAPILIDPSDDAAVVGAARNLAGDFGRVGGTNADLLTAAPARVDSLVIVGTLNTALVSRLVRSGRLDVRAVSGRWEAYVHQVVERPLPGVARALVIAGADRRGTVFGIYDLSKRIGVSPWHWWADVPPRRHSSLYVSPGRRVEAPSVRYRGIFLNDEEPALGNWARQTFGGINAKFYERVFDLMLRSRANLIWPAMWGKSFYEDDPANGRLAHEMGIIVSTSHHEPLMRAHVDWERHGQGPWDYTRNADRLRRFWKDGVERTNGFERLVTVGMRGDGDEPMTKGTATRLLETIVADQRRIIAEATARPAAETPQVWALYKEVQDYYDAGMRVPDDVTLLFADDNWGNIRRLPEPGATMPRGYGVYYHFDYVGGPRNYKWIDTNSIPRVWQQMRMAYEFGARQLWIVNVGDLKPMEMPTSFFLDMAWDPAAMTLERMDDYPRRWAAAQFGEAQAAAIGDALARYGQLIARRKPELLEANTYEIGSEWPRVIGEWTSLERDALAIERAIPAAARDAYFQLVLHRVLASANLHRLYFAAAMGFESEARRAFAADAALRRRYEVETAGGKWAHMMSQTHIGYTGWQEPPKDSMPEVKRVGTSARPSFSAVVPVRPSSTRRSGPFIEADRVVAIEAEHAARKVASNGVGWMVIPRLGRTLSGVAATPEVAPAAEPRGGEGARLEYEVILSRSGPLDLLVYASPGLDVTGRGRHRYAASIDGGQPRMVDLLAGETEATWNRAVADNIRIGTTRFDAVAAGRHVVKLWRVDPGVVFQRLVLARGPLPRTYLGPPESPRAGRSKRG